jgi:hypothetical protein
MSMYCWQGYATLEASILPLVFFVSSYRLIPSYLKEEP